MHYCNEITMESQVLYTLSGDKSLVIISFYLIYFQVITDFDRTLSGYCMNGDIVDTTHRKW